MFTLSTIASWAMLTSEPIKLLDAISAHPDCQYEFGLLLDSIAQKFEELEDALEQEATAQQMLREDLDEMESDKDYWEDKAGEFEDKCFELECKVEKLEQELEELRAEK
jgi:septal ring factor EnvC (AmiA/AmiB activator)